MGRRPSTGHNSAARRSPQTRHGHRRIRPAVLLVTVLAAVVALLLPSATPASAAPPLYEVADTIQMPGQTTAITVDAHRGVVYVMMPSLNLIRMIDADSLSTIADITVGTAPQRPRQMAVDPVSGLLLVTVSQVNVTDTDTQLAVIDPASASVIDSVQIGNNGYGITVSAVSRTVYVGNVQANTSVTVLDLSVPTAPTVRATFTTPGVVERVTESPDGALLYAAPGVNSTYVWVLDATTGDLLQTWSGFRYAHQVMLSSGEDLAFVSQQLGTTASVVDVASGETVSTIALSNTYYQASDENGAVLITAPFLNGGTVGVLDAATGELTATLAVDDAFFVATDPGRGLAFVTSIDSSGIVTVLRTVQPPAVTTDPTDVAVVAGTQATFTAVVDPATAAVQWQRSDDGGTTWTEVSGADQTTLSFVATSADTGAQFRAAFTNAAGSAVSAAATVTVLTTATVIEQPVAVTVDEGGSASFTSTATGDPAPTVSWQRSNDGGATWTDIPDATTTTLTLEAVTAADTDTLVRAVFTSSAGTVASDSALLTVIPAASIPADQDDSGAPSGSTDLDSPADLSDSAAQSTDSQVTSPAQVVEEAAASAVKHLDPIRSEVLATTGVSARLALAVGAGLLIAGALAVMFARRWRA